MKEVADIELGKKLDKVAIIISIAVVGLVIFMRGDYKPDLGIDTTFIPRVNAILNTGVAIALLAALVMIKQKKVAAHQLMINVAMVLSALFLVGYVLYHFTNYETSYCGEGTGRTVYFTLLITHIIFAGLSLPFILFTYIRAFTGQYEAHRKLAKRVWPVWFYVAITGPIVYLMLSPCYEF
jgi:putative membrane protein